MSTSRTKSKRPSPNKGKKWKPTALRNPGSKSKLKLTLKEEHVLQLRLDGYTYDEIGRKIGMTGGGVHNIVMRKLKEQAELTAEKVAEVRQLEVTRCDNHLKALQPQIKKGNVGAILAAQKVAERRSKLLGLDAPKLVDNFAGEGGAIAVDAFRKMLDDAGNTGDGEDTGIAEDPETVV